MELEYSVRCLSCWFGLKTDELQTAFNKVEALMNSRPLIHEGADPQDEPVLAPNSFLDGHLGGQLHLKVTNDIASNPRNCVVEDLFRT